MKRVQKTDTEGGGGGKEEVPRSENLLYLYPNMSRERERRGKHPLCLLPKPLKTMGSADMAYPTKQCQLT